nr:MULTISPECIES: hypothetical protein [unclassified Janthinobacterium]
MQSFQYILISVYSRMEKDMLCWRGARIVLPIEFIANRYLTGLPIPECPFIRDIAPGFDGAIADPSHEFMLKLELCLALSKQEAPDVLGAFFSARQQPYAK